jgi:hypothetical protein
VATSFKEVTYEVDSKGCWNCTSHCLNGGYPMFRRNGQRVRLSRWVLQEKLGRPIKEGLLACHRCNNTTCVNPDHIYEGTPLENAKDCLNAGTHVSLTGESNPASKLTEDSVRYIRSNPDIPQRKLAEILGVSQTAVWQVRNHVKWNSNKGVHK